MAPGERRQRCDTDGALAAERGDPCGGVLLDQLNGAGQLFHQNPLGLDAADPLQALVAHHDGHHRGGSCTGR